MTTHSSKTTPPLPYQLDAAVCVETGTDRLAAEEALILQSGLLQTLETEFQRSCKPKNQFLIAIKTDLSPNQTQQSDCPLHMDSVFIERLNAWFMSHGFTHVQVLGEDAADKDSPPFDYGGVLGLQVVARAWRDADFRLSIARCRTHARFLYSGCLHNLSFHSPASGLRHANGHRAQHDEICVLIADRFPVHFGILDAWVSGDGHSGRDPNPTKTLIASRNILALDWVAGEKMNINPAFNAILQEAMHRWGTVTITRLGNQTPWSPWTNAGLLNAALTGILKRRN